MKTCSKCHETKPLEEGFYRHPTGADGYTGQCRRCKIDHNLARRAANPGQRRAAVYGMTPEQVEEMLAEQGGRCAICRTDSPTGRWNKLAVDHDHRTGKVRGLLCASCNNGLGRFFDDPERLIAAADYLRRSA